MNPSGIGISPRAETLLGSTQGTVTSRSLTLVLQWYLHKVFPEQRMISVDFINSLQEEQFTPYRQTPMRHYQAHRERQTRVINETCIHCKYIDSSWISPVHRLPHLGLLIRWVLRNLGAKRSILGVS